MTDTLYYIVTDGRQAGPFTFDALSQQALSPDTLVWKAGLPDWVRASQLPELTSLLLPPAPPQPVSETIEIVDHTTAPVAEYFMMSGMKRIGPLSLEMLVRQGVNPSTPVWTEGMADWAPTSTRPEIMDALANRLDQQRQYPGYAAPRQPQQSQNAITHYNWTTWAIIGTIAGALFSCIGLIFGIIGIVKANEANAAYARGDEQMGVSANATAKTMTIIALVLAGIGLIATCTLFSTAFGSGVWNAQLFNGIF